MDCKSAPRCSRCGNTRHESSKDCPRANLLPICCNCHQEHFPFSLSCPHYIKQKQIYAMAAIENISYSDTRFKLGYAGPSDSSSSSLNSSSLSVFPSLPHRSSLSVHILDPRAGIHMYPSFFDNNLYTLLGRLSDDELSPPPPPLNSYAATVRASTRAPAANPFNIHPKAPSKFTSTANRH